MGPELDLRPQLERLDRLICWSENIDEGALAFAFRPLWQLDEPARAALALSRAQATQIYAGLKLWPTEVLAKLAEAQLAADGTYPNAAAVFAEHTGASVADAREVGEVTRAGASWPGETEPRDWHGRWTRVAGIAPRVQGVQLAHAGEDPFAGGDPNIEEQLRKTEELQQHRLDIGPSLIPKETPEGTVELASPSGIFFVAPRPPKVTPAAETVTPPGPIQTPPPAPTVSRDLRGIVGPGPYARESVPAGPSSRPNSEQKRQVDLVGRRWGCHRCGSKDPGSRFGRFLCDHQFPTALNPEGCPQAFYPHCQTCSDEQGGIVRGLQQNGYQP